MYYGRDLDRVVEMKKPSTKILAIITLFVMAFYSLNIKYGIEFVMPSVALAIAWLFRIREREKLSGTP
jgi:hypothetical protein